MRGQEVILLNFPISHFFKSFAHSALLTEGGGGVQEPLILADVICEQPLNTTTKLHHKGWWQNTYLEGKVLKKGVFKTIG